MNLERAIEIAVEAHKGQVDKGGNPYILHPLRLMHDPSMYNNDLKIVAILHDLIEDTCWTFDDLIKEGFSQSVVDGIASVTRRKDETRKEFIKRAKSNELGRWVKYIDLKDNSNLTRLQVITETDQKRTQRYLDEMVFLMEN